MSDVHAWGSQEYALEDLIKPWAQILPYPVSPHPNSTPLLGVPLLHYKDANKVAVPILPLGPNLALTSTWALSDIESMPQGVGRSLLLFPPRPITHPNLRVLWAPDGWHRIVPGNYLETGPDTILFYHSEVRIAVVKARVANILKVETSYYPEKYNLLPNHQSGALVYSETYLNAQLRYTNHGQLLHHWRTPMSGPLTATNFLDKLTTRIGRTLKRSGAQLFAERALCT